MQKLLKIPFHQNWKPGADFLLKHLGETNAKCKPEDEFVSLLKFWRSGRLGLAGTFLPKQMTTCCNLNFVSNIYYSSEFYSISYCFVVVQSLSHIQLFVTCSSPRLTGPSHLPEFAQTEIHWVSDAIQPSHSLSPSSLLALNLSQHQGPTIVYLWANY